MRRAGTGLCRAQRSLPRDRRRRVICVGAALFVVFTIASEFTVRELAEQRFTQTLEVALKTTDVDTHIGWPPVLLDLAAGRIPTVRSTARNATVCGFADITLTGVAQDVSPSAAGNVRVGATHVRADIPSSAMVSDLVRRFPAGELLGLTQPVIAPDVVRQLLDLQVGPSGAGLSVQLKPALDGDRVTFRVTSASFFGSRVGIDSLGVDTESTVASLDYLPANLRPMGLAVTRSGLSLGLASRGGTFRPQRTLSCHLDA